MATLRTWIAATRPRTLPAAVAPVAVGTALARQLGYGWDPRLALGCVGVAVTLQIAANLANDLVDGLRGSDGAERQGPSRAVASGTISPRAMAVATGIMLALGFAIGVVVAAMTSWWLLALGIACMLGAVLYTAGPFAFAYRGLGDVATLVFFGFAAVLGSAAIHHLDVLAPWWGTTGLITVTVDGLVVGETILLLGLPLGWWLLAMTMGLLATGILTVNNLRDREQDAANHKRTLIVRLSPAGGQRYFASLYWVAAACLAGAALTLNAPGLVVAGAAAAVLGNRLAAAVRKRSGSQLNPFLGRAAMLELIVAGIASAALTAASP